MVVTLMTLLNALCLVALAVMLLRLRHPVSLGTSPESFAGVLEAATPPVGALIAGTRLEAEPAPADAKSAEPATGSGGAPERNDPIDQSAAAALSLADRLAVIRCMLHGMSIDETAGETGATLPSVRAIYHLHGREEAGKC